MTSPAPGAETGSEPISAWARLRSYVAAPGTLLAIVQISSPAHADRVAADLRRLVGDDHLDVFRASEHDDYREILDWLEARDREGAVLLLTGLRHYAREPDQAREFWTWADMQRERWALTHGKVIFLLERAQVDHLYRHAPMLRDWIPLEFVLHGELPSALIANDQLSHIDDRDRQSAIALLPALREQLLRARQIGTPEEVIRHSHAWPLFRALVTAEHWNEAQAVLHAELDPEFAARMPAHKAGEAWLSLAKFRWKHLHDRAAAERAIQAALATFEHIDDRAGVARSYHRMGIVTRESGDLHAAESAHHKALAISREIGDRCSEGVALGNLGIVYKNLGELEQAIDLHQQALVISRELGDRRGEGADLGNLGLIYADQGEMERAIDLYQQALAISREIGDRRGECNALANLGLVYSQIGQVERARRLHEQSLAIAKQIRHPRLGAFVQYQVEEMDRTGGMAGDEE